MVNSVSETSTLDVVIKHKGTDGPLSYVGTTGHVRKRREDVIVWSTQDGTRDVTKRRGRPLARGPVKPERGPKT